MRIRRSSTRSSSDLAVGRAERARAFRAAHSPGQRVEGVYMKRDHSGMAWVSFDGLPLLADIETTARPGARLAFVIQSLTPEIVLKEIASGARGSGGAAALVKEYDLLRGAFESCAGKPLRAQSGKPGVSARRDRLLAALPEPCQEKLLAAWGALGLINAALSRTGPTRLLYLPWLVPDATRQDLLVRREARQDGVVFTELSFGFEAADLGPATIRLLSRISPEGGDRTGIRVWLEDQRLLPRARAVLKALGSTAEPEVSYLGAEKAPRYAHGGVLSELLTPDPHKLLGLGA